MSLAIVIPAYKNEYLEAALSSISSQTDKSFKVYVGDDNSPNNLLDVVSKYSSQLDIVYKKFHDNLGSLNLTRHWDRCISMTENEDWIWLFSDDDLMDENCVRLFNNALVETNAAFDLYRYNTCIIDETGKVLQANKLHPLVETSIQFGMDRLNLNRNSYVVEYIFSKKKYIETGGFVSFPLAWSSDDATWINIGFDKGIFTISDAYVYWRYSFTNISSKPGFVEEKIEASIQYLIWLKNWIKMRYSSNEHLTYYENIKFGWIKHQMKLLNVRFGVYHIYKLSNTLNLRLSIPIQTSIFFFLGLILDDLKYKLKKKLRKFIKGS
jgi:glycosyltransferase involved in cell wall biosynthesis